MYFLFKMGIFHDYVSLPEGIWGSISIPPFFNPTEFPTKVKFFDKTPPKVAFGIRETGNRETVRW